MTAKNQIVIVTQLDDPHTDEMILMLREIGQEPIRLNTDDIPLHTAMSFDLGTDPHAWNGAITIQTNGRVIDVADIRSIWWRRPSTPRLPQTLSERERVFAQMEIEHALSGLWAGLDCHWISHPEAIRQASWKSEQLQRAARMGFAVPRTLITTEPEAARAFYAACDGRMIFKVMTDPFLGLSKMAEQYPDQAADLRGTYTTLITDAELGMLDTIKLVPCLFQEYVPKLVELRVTVIGGEIFAAEIHSQEQPATSIDWRHYDVDIPYRPTALPPEIAELCLAFVKSYGLNFSALDLILTPDGRYVFIENNPNGQFIFIEKLVPELTMTAALADCLARGGS